MVFRVKLKGPQTEELLEEDWPELLEEDSEDEEEEEEDGYTFSRENTIFSEFLFLPNLMF